jgi:hypothetical protein
MQQITENMQQATEIMQQTSHKTYRLQHAASVTQVSIGMPRRRRACLPLKLAPVIKVSIGMPVGAPDDDAYYVIISGIVALYVPADSRLGRFPLRPIHA